jgi:septal ring factor EnvC (AmiA/AmiB activator)
MKALLLFFFCWIYFPFNLFAEQNTRLLKVQEKIKSVSSKLSTLKKQEGKAQNKLKQLERQYGKISQKVRHLALQLREKKQRIKEIQQDIKEQQKWLFGQENYIAGQARAAYILGKQEPLKLLLSQEDIGKVSRMMRYYYYFNKDRVNQVQQINNSLQLLKGLEKEKQQELQRVSELAVEQKQKQKKLVQTKYARKKLLKSIKKDFKTQKYKLSKLKKNAQKLKGLVNTLRLEKQRPVAAVKSVLPFRHLKAKMSWPIKGKIIKYFGNRRVDSRWNGVLMRAKEGTKIKVIAAGQIVYADWFKGYGLLIIVKHDKDYMSLYAYNQSLYQTKGDWVSAGDVVATVGKSGGRDKSALYFEIRKKDKPINPAKWCR